jgi:hypothetical protein
MIDRVKLPPQPEAPLMRLSPSAFAVACATSDGSGATRAPASRSRWASAGNNDAATEALRARKSGRDLALRELGALKLLVVASEADEIEAHAGTVREVPCDIIRVASSQWSGTGHVVRPPVDVWLTVTQPLLQTDDPLAVVPASEKFNRTGAGPIKGPWAKPA